MEQSTFYANCCSARAERAKSAKNLRADSLMMNTEERKETAVRTGNCLLSSDQSNNRIVVSQWDSRPFCHILTITGQLSLPWMFFFTSVLYVLPRFAPFFPHEIASILWLCCELGTAAAGRQQRPHPEPSLRPSPASVQAHLSPDHNRCIIVFDLKRCSSPPGAESRFCCSLVFFGGGELYEKWNSSGSRPACHKKKKKKIFISRNICEHTWEIKTRGYCSAVANYLMARWWFVISSHAALVYFISYLRKTICCWNNSCHITWQISPQSRSRAAREPIPAPAVSFFFSNYRLQ